MAATLTRIARPAGYLVTALSLLYLAGILWRFDWHTLQFRNPLVSLGILLLFGVWASLFVVVGAYNWKLILEFVNGESLPARDLFRVYLKSNIAKYLPGNVMHYAGRHYLGSRLGWKNGEIAFSSLLEYIFGSALTGLIILVLLGTGLVTVPPGLSLAVDIGKVVRYGAVAVTLLLVAVYLYRYLACNERPIEATAALRDGSRRFFTPGFLLLCARMFAISLGCFILNCCFYVSLCDLLLGFPIRPADFFNANAALSIAGYASIITPGAPGGIGVKESVSLLLLSAYGYPREGLALSLVVFRIACVLGDLLPYLLVKALERGGDDA